MFNGANAFSNSHHLCTFLTVHGFDRSLPRICWWGIPAAQVRNTL